MLERKKGRNIEFRGRREGKRKMRREKKRKREGGRKRRRGKDREKKEKSLGKIGKIL